MNNKILAMTVLTVISMNAESVRERVQRLRFEADREYPQCPEKREGLRLRKKLLQGLETCINLRNANDEEKAHDCFCEAAWYVRFVEPYASHHAVQVAENELKRLEADLGYGTFLASLSGKKSCL